MQLSKKLVEIAMAAGIATIGAAWPKPDSKQQNEHDTLALFAQESPGGMASPGASMAKVKCVGGNDCKGKGSCKGAGHDCQGKNSCKGKGFVETSTAKECKAMHGKPSKMKGMKM